MSTRTPIEIVLYERPGCCLCQSMLDAVNRLRTEFPLHVTCVDVDGDPDLKARFGTEVPVLFIGGRKAFKYRVGADELRRRLARAVGDS
jgi:hypothetical protein